MDFLQAVGAPVLKSLLEITGVWLGAPCGFHTETTSLKKVLGVFFLEIINLVIELYQ